MAYRRLSIENVATLVGHWQGRESERKIARLTGIDRKTVRRYLAAAEAASLTREHPLTEGDFADLAKRVQSRSPSVSSATRSVLAGHELQISAWLEASPPLRLREIHRRLVAKDVQVTYWTLRRFAMLARPLSASHEEAPESGLSRAQDSGIPRAPDSGVQTSDRGHVAEFYPHELAREVTA